MIIRDLQFLIVGEGLVPSRARRATRFPRGHPAAPRAFPEGQRMSTREGTKATAGRALPGHEG
jgi:hypothetical protein